MNMNNMLENLKGGSWENKAIYLLAEFWVDRNNIKSFECCSEFSDCTIEQEWLPCDIKGVYITMVNVKWLNRVCREHKNVWECYPDEHAMKKGGLGVVCLNCMDSLKCTTRAFVSIWYLSVIYANSWILVITCPWDQDMLTYL